MLKITSILLTALIVAGCGTTQPFVPAIAMQKGQGEIRVSVGYSTSNFNPFTLQLGGFFFVGNSDAVGVIFAGLVFPSTVSYVHYPSRNFNFQLHYNDLLGATYNPTFEIDLALSSGSWDKYNSAKLGLGFYDTPLLQRLAGNRVTGHAFVPVFGYQLRNREFELEANLLYGMSDYFVDYYNQEYLQHHRDTSQQSAQSFRPQEISRESVRSVGEIPKSVLAPGWYISLASDETIVIASRDPYADCIACGFEQSHRAAFLASPDHKVYWVWQSKSGEERFPFLSFPALMQLNMPKTLDQYSKGGNLVLKEDDDLLQRIHSNVHSGIQDIFFSVAKLSQMK